MAIDQKTGTGTVYANLAWGHPHAVEVGPGVSLTDTDLQGADFRGADLRGAYFSSLSLRDADFTDADLEGAQFYRSDLAGAVFEGANLREARLSSSPLDSVNFANACMVDANIYGTPEPVRGLNFKGADLRGASIEQLFVQDSDFTGALLSLSGDQISEYFNCMYEFPSGGECFTPAIIEVLSYAKRHGCRGLEPGAQGVMDQFREALDVFHANRRAEAIRAGAYLGFVEGLWIHQTDEPKFQYHGEFCVSPYSDDEERFYSGGRVFGVIMSGVAELFADDVWSAPDVFGRLIPNRFVVREGHHKEAFIHGDEARIIGLTYPTYAEKVPKLRAVIREWRSAGYLTVPIVL